MDDEELYKKLPWSDKGEINAFHEGQKFGAHDLADEILAILYK